MEQSKLHGISWKAYTIFQIVAIAITTVTIVNPLDRYVSKPFEVYTGESWSTFASEQPKYAALYEMFCRGSAGGVFSLILLGLFITLTAYRKGEKWACIALLAGLIAFNAIQIVNGYIINGAAGTIENILWLCVGLAILMIPATFSPMTQVGRTCRIVSSIAGQR